MNHSIYGADRPTHLKIVVVALLASVGLTGLAVSARIYSSGAVYSRLERLSKIENVPTEHPLAWLTNKPLCST